MKSYTEDLDSFHSSPRKYLTIF